MSNVLILGANGRIARLATERLLAETGDDLTLMVRRPHPLAGEGDPRVRVVVADATDPGDLVEALDGVDLVVSTIGPGQGIPLARSLVTAMDGAGVKRLVFVSALGVYDEVPGAFGRWNTMMVGPGMDEHKVAVGLLEASDLDYTILRLAWLTDYDEVDYETTEKGEPFRGTEVSRKSVADLIVRIIADPALHARGSIGVDKPGTDGPKPAFY
jgi:uncharacterized protein YbjT (DUF2867 family)